MKFGKLAAVAVFSAASAGFSAPVFSAPPPPGAFLREDGNYWMHGPQHDYIIGPASAFSAPVTVDIRMAPPAPRYEVVPVDRPGYTWAPGYWDYRHNRYQLGGGPLGARAPGLLLQRADLGPARRPLDADPRQPGSAGYRDRNAALARSRPRRHPEPLRPRPRQRRHPGPLRPRPRQRRRAATIATAVRTTRVVTDADAPGAGSETRARLSR